MMLIEEGTVPDADLPLVAFKEHLRLGTGFGEENLQDSVLRGFLRAAMAAVEARTSKILLARDFSLTLGAWRNAAAQPLPVAPVQSILSMVLVDRFGGETSVAPAQFRLEQDSQKPRIRPIGQSLATIPLLGSVRVLFRAGMAPAWEGLPADLAQAVLLLAAHYYEYRDETSLSDGCMPFGVSSLIERYRPLRLYVGGLQ